MGKGEAIHIDVAPRKGQIDKALKELAHIKDGTPRAVSAALNKTATGAKTDIKRLVVADYFVKQKDVGETLSIKKASPGNLTATVITAGSVIPLIKFRVSRRTPPTPKRGVKVNVKRDGNGGIAGKGGQKGFLAAMHSGHTGIFVRAGKGRFPIKELMGPAVPSMVNKHIEEINTKVQARLDKNMDHEIDRIERGFGK